MLGQLTIGAPLCIISAEGRQKNTPSSTLEPGTIDLVRFIIVHNFVMLLAAHSVFVRLRKNAHIPGHRLLALHAGGTANSFPFTAPVFSVEAS